MLLCSVHCAFCTFARMNPGQLSIGEGIALQPSVMARMFGHGLQLVGLYCATPQQLCGLMLLNVPSLPECAFPRGSEGAAVFQHSSAACGIGIVLLGLDITSPCLSDLVSSSRPM